jgi:hypothetical protein
MDDLVPVEEVQDFGRLGRQPRQLVRRNALLPHLLVQLPQVA